jgi:hypothetical protein
MSSCKDSLPIDLEADLPTTQADVDALRRLGRVGLQVTDYLAFLATFGDATPEQLRARPGPRGEKPFSF